MAKRVKGNTICWKVGKCHLYYICRSLPRFEAESRPPQWAQGMIFRFPFKRDVLILIHPISYGKGTSVEIWEFIHIYDNFLEKFTISSWVPKYVLFRLEKIPKHKKKSSHRKHFCWQWNAGSGQFSSHSRRITTRGQSNVGGLLEFHAHPTYLLRSFGEGIQNSSHVICPLGGGPHLLFFCNPPFRYDKLFYTHCVTQLKL